MENTPAIADLDDSLDTQSSSAPTVGLKTMSERIEELKNALSQVERNFTISGREIKQKIRIWSFVCIWGVAICGQLAISFLSINLDEYHHQWTWEIIYYTSIRLIIVGFIISLMSFCFKMLRSYMHMSEYNKHKLAIIKSMAYLVGAGKNQTQRDLVFSSLTQLIVDFGNIGIINQDNDFKSSSAYLEIAEKVLKLKKD